VLDDTGNILARYCEISTSALRVPERLSQRWNVALVVISVHVAQQSP